MEITTLTNEQILSLDSAACQRLLGDHTKLLVENNEALKTALQERMKADCRLAELKQNKSVLIANMRALAIIAKNF
jgi:hypothetical protein